MKAAPLETISTAPLAKLPTNCPAVSTVLPPIAPTTRRAIGLDIALSTIAPAVAPNGESAIAAPNSGSPGIAFTAKSDAIEAPPLIASPRRPPAPIAGNVLPTIEPKSEAIVVERGPFQFDGNVLSATI